MIKKIVISGILLTLVLSAQTFQLGKGWNFIAITEKSNYTKKDLENELGSKFLNILTFNGNIPVSKFGINVLEEGKAYWIKTNESVTFTIPSTEKINPKYLSIGWNAVGFGNISTLDNLKTYYLSNYGYTIVNILTFNGNIPVSKFSISNIDPNKGYWVKVSDINYTKLLQNGLDYDSDLNITKADDLRDKSILAAKVADDNSSLEFELISFDNNDTYRKVVLENFDYTVLNRGDSDINSSLVSSVSSITSGECGNWNFESTNNLNFTPKDENGNYLSQMDATYNPNDGNLTINGYYYKVLWFGDKINLDNINCTFDNIYFPPMFPSQK